jgi:DNA-binding transcriptional LysR family regulator
MARINHVDWAVAGPMDIRDLDYFLARCKAGSFTAAARDACIVQSAMSSAIARLERDLGVRLFDRGFMPVQDGSVGLQWVGSGPMDIALCASAASHVTY